MARWRRLVLVLLSTSSSSSSSVPSTAILLLLIQIGVCSVSSVASDFVAAAWCGPNIVRGLVRRRNQDASFAWSMRPTAPPTPTTITSVALVGGNECRNSMRNRRWSGKRVGMTSMMMIGGTSRQYRFHSSLEPTSCRSTAAVVSDDNGDENIDESSISTQHQRTRSNTTHVEWVGAGPTDDDDTDAAATTTATTATWLSTVSDAEALLACRAHWQRRQRGDTWTAGLERKRQRLQQRQRNLDQFRHNSNENYSNNQDGVDSSSSVGFFWDNVQELVYFQYPKTSMSTDATTDANQLPVYTTDGSELESANADDAEMERVNGTHPFGAGTANGISVSFWDEEEDTQPGGRRVDAIVESADYSAHSFARHQKRSHAAQRLFADPDWKATWYERRWGNRHATSSTTTTTTTTNATTTTTRVDPHQRHRRKLEERVRRRLETTAQMDDFLSTQVAAMSEDEIFTAIQTYRQAKVKRAQTRQQNKIQQPLPWRPTTVNNDTTLDRYQQINFPSMVRSTQPREWTLASTKRHVNVSDFESPPSNTTNILGVDSGDSVDGALSIGTPAKALQYIQQYWLPQEAVTASPSVAAINTTLRSHDNVVVVVDRQCRSWQDWSDLEQSVDCLLEPGKLTGRKETVRDLLRHVFFVRGKCVPSKSSSSIHRNSIQLLDVTKATVPEMILYAGSLIRAKKIDLETTTKLDEANQQLLD